MSKIFLIDVAKCSGCHNCQLSCKDEHCENDWRPYAAPQPATGQFWCKVESHTRGTVPKVKMHYTPTFCNHCDNAPCMAAAENGAVYRRSDGLIVIDPEKAAGQKALVESCPYGAIYWNETLNLPQKCTGCAHLLDNGAAKPRCVEACPTDALQFGDEEDFAELLKDAVCLHPEYGTGPRVYYRNIPGRFIAGTVYDPVEEEVVIGAVCTLTSGETVLTTKTDSFGDFWFRDLPENATYDLVIEAAGYQAKHFEALCSTPDVNLEDIPLEK